jgi:hypothetical protein
MHGSLIWIHSNIKRYIILIYNYEKIQLNKHEQWGPDISKHKSKNSCIEDTALYEVQIVYY